MDRQDAAGQSAGIRPSADNSGEAPGLLRRAVPAGRGRCDLLLAAGRSDRGAVGAAYPGRFCLQHQGVQPAHRAPDQAVERDLQGSAAGDRQEERSTPTTCRRRPTRRSGRGSCPRSIRWSRRASSARSCSSSRRGSPSSTANKQYLIEVAKRCSPLRAVIELRHESWFAGDNQAETLDFLRTAPPAVRQRRHAAGPQVVDPAGAGGHQRPGRGALPRPQRQVDEQEHLREVRVRVLRRASSRDWAPKLEKLSREAAQLHVLMNNCRGDFAQRNAAAAAQTARRLSAACDTVYA